jgi:hypothetical protein
VHSSSVIARESVVEFGFGTVISTKKCLEEDRGNARVLVSFVSSAGRMCGSRRRSGRPADYSAVMPASLITLPQRAISDFWYFPTQRDHTLLYFRRFQNCGQLGGQTLNNWLRRSCRHEDALP